jgi:hypothetical protein
MVARPGSVPRRLVARSLDPVARQLLSSDLAWRVHSVFERAANLRSDAGDLLGLALAPAPNAPATIVLASDGDGRALADDLRPGAPVRHEGDAVVIDDGPVIDLLTAVLWSPPPIRRTATASNVLERIQDAQDIGSRYAPTGGLAPLLSRVDAPGAPASTAPPTPRSPKQGRGETMLPPLPKGEGWGEGSSSLLGALGRERRGAPGGDALIARTSEGIEHLTRGWRSSDAETFASGAHLLSGLGPGLTPSGDDLLAGFALGIWAAHGALPNDLAVAIEDAIVGRTTDLAVARVQHAVAGRADEFTHAVLRALVTDDSGDLPVSVVRLLGYGHTSGADTLVGLLLGVRLGLP